MIFWFLRELKFISGSNFISSTRLSADGSTKINLPIFSPSRATSIFWLSISSIFLGIPGFVISRMRILLGRIELKLNLTFVFLIGEKNSIPSEVKMSSLPYLIVK